MSDLMTKTAAVLEALADQLDQQEQHQREAAREERRKVARALSEKVAAATGEELSSEVLEHLANSDVDVIDAFTKLAERAPPCPS